MNSLAFATISQLRALLRTKQISPAELLDFYIARFARYDGGIGSALEIFERNSVLASCDAHTIEHGPLGGVPGIIKDTICQQGRIASCASKILENYSATYDATAIARLKNDGALLLGRANCDEFAMGSSTETSAYKKTKNPWDVSRVPGGSSGGSIAAVAAGLVPWALGTETGGSVRQPAAFCGVVGSKPTYGLVSRYGLIAYGSSLDQIGVATRSVYDNALVLSSIAGEDPHDSTSLLRDRIDYTHGLDGTLPENLRIGVVENALYATGMDPEIVASIEESIRVLESLGAKIERVKMPAFDYGAATYFIISRAEAASNLARFDGIRYGLRHEGDGSLSSLYQTTRHDGFGKEVKVRIMVGNYVLSAGHAGQYYANAMKVRSLLRYAFDEIFKKVDVLVMPTHPEPAFAFGAYASNPLAMDLQDYFTCPMNLAGVPALSVPCGYTKQKLPIGFQFVGPHCSEALLFKVGHAYEQATPWHTEYPPQCV